MVIKSAVASIFTYGYNLIRYCVDIVVYVVTLATSLCLIMLNAALSFLVVFEELAVVFLILPWIPTKRIGNLFLLLRKWGLPQNLTLAMYIFMGILFILLNLVGLELHYLHVNESLLTNFDDFKSSLFSAMKLFIVLHRLLHLISNESSLRNTCYYLKKRLKIEQDEELDAKVLELTADEDLEISDLRGELERTKLNLEAMKEAYDRLQQKLKLMSEGTPGYIGVVGSKSVHLPPQYR